MDSYSRYLTGDDGALAEMISEYRDGLTLYINGIVGDIFLSEDLMEEVFFRLVTKRPRFNSKSSLKTWLYAIGRNLALDSLRRKRRRDDTSIEDLDAALAEEETVERSYLRRERQLLLRRAMSRLNPDYRQILHLVYFEELSNSEAGSVMKRSRRQIENLLTRARAALKKELEKEGFTYEDL